MKIFMKRTLMILLAVVMLASLSIVAYAEETSVSGQGRNRGVGLVDENGDGVCDCFRTGRGIDCGRNQGVGFVDEDGDGVCDCFRTGHGIGRGRNLGAGFVDEDGDGVCDAFGIGRCSGRRCGQRNR